MELSDDDLEDERTQLQEDEEKLQSALQEGFGYEWDVYSMDEDEDEEQFLIDLDRESSAAITESGASSIAGRSQPAKVTIQDEESRGAGLPVVAISNLPSTSSGRGATALTEADPGKALAMNRALQGILEGHIEAIQDALETNKERQQMIEEDVNSTKRLVKKRTHGPFKAPYFRGLVEYPEPNEDIIAKSKMGHANIQGPVGLGKGVCFQHKHSKIMLKQRVLEDCIEQTIRPLMNRMEAEAERMSAAKDSLEEDQGKYVNAKTQLVNMNEDAQEEEKARLRASVEEIHKSINEHKAKVDEHSNNIAELELEIEAIKSNSNKDEILRNVDSEKVDWMRICRMHFTGQITWIDCLKAWEHMVNPLINTQPWKADEKRKLKRLAEAGFGNEEPHPDWTQVAKDLGTQRTAFQCLSTYQRYFNKNLRRRPWTKEEDKRLVEQAQKVKDLCGAFNWTKIAQLIDNRSPYDCSRRFCHVGSHHSIGKFSKEEDAKILAGVEMFGTCWHKVARFVGTRTQLQVRERYVEQLNPELNLTPFTYDEDALLLKLYAKLGPAWAVMAKQFNKRMASRLLQRHKQLRNWKKRKEWFDKQPVDVKNLLLGRKLLPQDRHARKQMVIKHFTEILGIDLEDYNRQKMDRAYGVKPEYIPPRPPFILGPKSQYNLMSKTSVDQNFTNWSKKVATHQRLQQNLTRLLKEHRAKERAARQANPKHKLPAVLQEEAEENILNKAVNETLETEDETQLTKTMIEKMNGLLAKAFLTGAKVSVAEIIKSVTNKFSGGDGPLSKQKENEVDRQLRRLLMNDARSKFRHHRLRKYFERDTRSDKVINAEIKEIDLETPPLLMQALGLKLHEVYEQVRCDHLALQESLVDFPSYLDDPELMAQQAKLDIMKSEINAGNYNASWTARKLRLVKLRHDKLERLYREKYDTEKSRMKDEVYELQGQIKNLHQLLVYSSDLPAGSLEASQPVWWESCATSIPQALAPECVQPLHPNAESVSARVGSVNEHPPVKSTSILEPQDLNAESITSPLLPPKESASSTVAASTPSSITLSPAGGDSTSKDTLNSKKQKRTSQTVVKSGAAASAGRRGKRLAPQVDWAEATEVTSNKRRKLTNERASLKTNAEVCLKESEEINKVVDEIRILTKDDIEKEKKRVNHLSESIVAVYPLSEVPDEVPSMPHFPPNTATATLLKHLLLKRGELMRKSAALGKVSNFSLRDENEERKSSRTDDIIVVDSSGKEIKAEELACFLAEDEGGTPSGQSAPDQCISTNTDSQDYSVMKEEVEDSEVVRSAVLDSFIQRSNRWAPTLKGGADEGLRSINDVVGSHPEYNVANFALFREKNGSADPETLPSSMDSLPRAAGFRMHEGQEVVIIPSAKEKTQEEVTSSSYTLVVAPSTHNQDGLLLPGKEGESRKKRTIIQVEKDSEQSSNAQTENSSFSKRKVSKTQSSSSVYKDSNVNASSSQSQFEFPNLYHTNREVIDLLSDDSGSETGNEDIVTNSLGSGSRASVRSTSTQQSAASKTNNVPECTQKKKPQQVRTYSKQDVPKKADSNSVQIVELSSDSEREEIEIAKKGQKFQKLVQDIQQEQRASKTEIVLVDIAAKKNNSKIVHFKITEEDIEDGMAFEITESKALDTAEKINPMQTERATQEDQKFVPPPRCRKMPFKVKASDSKTKKEPGNKITITAPGSNQPTIGSLQEMIKQEEVYRKQCLLPAIRESHEYKMLRERMQALFLWPVLMSTVKMVKSPHILEYLADGLNLNELGKRSSSKKGQKIPVKPFNMPKKGRKFKVKTGPKPKPLAGAAVPSDQGPVDVTTAVEGESTMNKKGTKGKKKNKTKRLIKDCVPREKLPRRAAAMTTKVNVGASTSTSASSLSGSQVDAEVVPKKKNMRGRKPKKVKPIKAVLIPQWWKDAILEAMLARQRLAVLGTEDDVKDIEEDEDFIDKGNYSDDEWVQEWRRKEAASQDSELGKHCGENGSGVVEIEKVEEENGFAVQRSGSGEWENGNGVGENGNVLRENGIVEEEYGSDEGENDIVEEKVSSSVGENGVVEEESGSGEGENGIVGEEKGSSERENDSEGGKGSSERGKGSSERENDSEGGKGSSERENDSDIGENDSCSGEQDSGVVKGGISVEGNGSVEIENSNGVRNNTNVIGKKSNDEECVDIGEN